MFVKLITSRFEHMIFLKRFFFVDILNTISVYTVIYVEVRPCTSEFLQIPYKWNSH